MNHMVMVLAMSEDQQKQDKHLLMQLRIGRELPGFSPEARAAARVVLGMLDGLGVADETKAAVILRDPAMKQATIHGLRANLKLAEVDVREEWPNR